ncbi:ribonuclease R [Desulfobulbus alkaliphilus]|uniref:ribonuclease R n=1 Tax=Desulfobulbus alkaliphilus TaxID=869814 RepID=UPI0019653790|nr:ribonuclease R [Desulfobulbus alkaliphilus]MBM9537848.1 ribonuclease R [Desulfobulbus alkaliphilus]
MLQSKILTLLAEHDQALTITAIMEKLRFSPDHLPLLHKALLYLVENGTLEKKGSRFGLPAQPAALSATLDLNAKGFGFALIEGEDTGGRDVFIPPHQLNGASHGDHILVMITGTSRNRREGRVVRIVSRAVTRLCGLFTATAKGGHVLPDDNRLPYTLLIRAGDDRGAADGVAVLAEITDYGSERQGPSGRVVEILGDPRSVAVQLRMAIFQSGLRDRFPAEVEAEAAGLTAVTTCSGDRVDLRHLPHVTIDGETAKDFDDAICVEKTTEGFTLHVSIADVAHYVRPGSPIDREAYLRGTSVYLPDTVLPMLPERLSNDLCSLVAHQDRPAFTATLTFDHQGRRISQHYRKSMIRSRQRFTYTTVYQLLNRIAPEMQAPHADLLAMLDQARQLTALLKKQRMARGSLEFNIPEPQVTLENDHVASISLAERNEAHMLVEDCMLAANEAVAETLAKAQQTVLFRIHEYPDPTKLEAFTDTVRALGLIIPEAEVNPAWFARVIRQAHNAPAEYIVNTLLLRTMQQARYSPENVGHFGLAASFYLHFTSPIRRYPDLIAHRVLHALLTGQSNEIHDLPCPEEDKDPVRAGLHLSQCERKAIDAERNAHARMAALFLLDRIGDHFTAIISGVTSSGLYIALDGNFISGSIPLNSMTDDYYLFDARRHRLIGEHSNTVYQLGNRVIVRLDHVDLAGKRLIFSLTSGEQTDEGD